MTLDLADKRILLLHGLTSSPQIFDKLVSNLDNNDIYCYAPILAGHREDSPDLHQVYFDSFITELEEYINYLTLGGTRKIHVVGASFGALLALTCLKKHSMLIEKIVVVSPPIEFRTSLGRNVLPLLAYLPDRIAKALGSIPKSRASDGFYEEGSYYTINSLSILAKLRKMILNMDMRFPTPSLLIQSSYDHHMNPHSLYILKETLFSENSTVVIQDWGACHNILELDAVVEIVSNFIMR